MSRALQLDQPRRILELLRIARSRPRTTYSRARAVALAQVANDRFDTSWQIRCVAAQLLAGELLEIEPADIGEFLWWFEMFGLLPDPRAVLLDADVLRQGFSTREPVGFIGEFRRQLHWRGGPDADARVGVLLERAEQPCRVALARYLISAEDVVARILSLCRTSEGVEQPGVGGQAVCDRLPRYEAAIVHGLELPGRVLWLSPNTRARINGLVEHPLGTAALVIKPPGSSLELEIKRVGLGPARPLDVIMRRGERLVPPSHRLQGLCLGKLLNYEVFASARLEALRAGVGSIEGGVARFVAVNRVSKVPVDSQAKPVSIVEYFSHPRYWPGPQLDHQFERLHADMLAAVDTFVAEGGHRRSSRLPGPLGLAAELYALTKPGQGALIGTSAFRLDQLARALGPEGPELHAAEIGHSVAAHHQLADTLLAEVLGDFAPPRASAGLGYVDYVIAARQHNQAAVERVFLNLAAELGGMFGLLVALRGYSKGESFVARNVGLRAVWERGEPRVRLVFMDHDDMHLPSPRHRLPILEVLQGLRLDHLFAFGAADETTSFAKLAAIYGCTRGDELYERARARLEHGCRATYIQAQTKIATDTAVARDLQIPRYADLDVLLAAYGSHRHGGPGWVSRIAEELEAAGCSPTTAADLAAYARDAEDFIAALAELTPTTTGACEQSRRSPSCPDPRG